MLLVVLKVNYCIALFMRAWSAKPELGWVLLLAQKVWTVKFEQMTSKNNFTIIYSDLLWAYLYFNILFNIYLYNVQQ